MSKPIDEEMKKASEQDRDRKQREGEKQYATDPKVSRLKPSISPAI